MGTVQEKDIDISEALGTQNQVYEEQRKDPNFAKNALASEEDINISKENLNKDITAKMERMRQHENSDGNGSGIVVQEGIDTSGIDQLKEREKEVEIPERSPQDILAELGLKEEPKVRKLSYNGQELEYVQKPLTFLGKIQFLSYVGEVLDKAMSGQNALQLNSLFEVPDYRGSTLTAQDFSDAQTFVQAVGKILIYAPDFLTKSYAIWLRVPEYERDIFAAAMEESLSDDDGIDIIETFIDQNWDTLQNFFNERLPKIRDRLSARYRASQSEQSKQ